MYSPDVRGPGIECDVLQFSSPDRVRHDELRFIQNPVTCDGSRDEGIAVVGSHCSVHSDTVFTILAIQPFIEPRDSRNGGTQTIVVSQLRPAFGATACRPVTWGRADDHGAFSQLA
jgi:hypothetical protein